MQKQTVEFVTLSNIINECLGFQMSPPDFEEAIRVNIDRYFTYGDTDYVLVHRQNLANTIERESLVEDCGESIVSSFFDRLGTLNCDYIAL